MRGHLRERFYEGDEQALLFSPDMEPTRFGIDKEVIDDNLYG